MARDRSEVHVTVVGCGAVLRGKFCSLSNSFFKLDISLRRPRSKSSWLEKSCSSREYHSPKEALHRFVTRLDRPCAACTWRSSPASTCNMARGEFDRSSWSSTSMITDRSPDDVFQLRKYKMTTKRRLGITQAFVSETILFTCRNFARKRGAFATPPWL